MPKTMNHWTAALAAMTLAAAAAACGDDDTSRLSDAEVLGVLIAANEGEVDVSQVGVEQASDAQVRDFATLMVEEHSAATARVQQLASSIGSAPDESSVSLRLQTDAETEQRRLEALIQSQGPGTEIDIRFMCAQVRLHRQVLETIDGSLVPSAEHAQVSAEVSTTRPKVAEHLQRARDLVQAIGATNTAGDPQAICADRGGV